MNKFKYHAPLTIKKSLEIYKKAASPKFIAGGMTLLAAMKQKMSSPSDLIDLHLISGLKKIEMRSDHLLIGAMNTHNEIAKSKLVASSLPGLSFLAKNIADNAVRNRGTLAGSICNADPSADYPAALLSLNAKIVTNERSINAKDFFVDMFETNLKENEIVTAVEFPFAKLTRYYKIKSLASKYAIIGIFVALKNDLAKFSVIGASNSVFLIKELNDLDVATLRKVDVYDIMFDDYFVNGDLHASADYKISLIQTTLKKAINFVIKNE